MDGRRQPAGRLPFSKKGWRTISLSGLGVRAAGAVLFWSVAFVPSEEGCRGRQVEAATMTPRHRGARKQRSHISARLYQRLKQLTGFMFHAILTQKVLLKCQGNCLSCGAGYIGENCTYITSNFRQNGSSDQPFPIIFSKNENDIYVQKVVFAQTLEGFFNISNPLHSYSHFSKFSLSKPPHVHWGG